MEKKLFPLAILLLVFSTAAMIVACDDDDDDNDDSAADDADDDTDDEDPCVAQAKLDAQEACETVGMDADLSHYGHETQGLECDYYCGGGYYYWSSDCLSGICICCE
ncbi:MAG TPA: hypothetical protein PKW95_21070 [bacterium]|nr:hypothetical protein [bacterium]